MLWPFFLAINVYIVAMRYLYFIALFIMMGLLSACNESDRIVIERSGTPALWKITQENLGTDNIQNRPSLYLFGTIHLLPKGTNWQSEILDKAIAASDHLIVETTGLDDSANLNKIFTSMASDEDTIAITQRVSGAELIALKNIIDDRGLSHANLSKMESWAAALAISSSLTNDMGLERDLGVETILHERFKGRPIEGLETIAAQFSIFDDLSEADQRTMLNAIINGSDQSQASLMRLLNAWLDGDNEALMNETDSGILSSPNVREALLDGRNRKWVKALEQKMSQDEDISYFVAVGAAHLVGENGVPELLRKAGYTVERVQ